MEDNSLPIIETRPLYDDYTDGLIRCDRVGDACFLTYGARLIDPSINDGREFITPVVRMRWQLPRIRSHSGTVRNWIESGPAEGSYMVPLLRRVPKRELM